MFGAHLSIAGSLASALSRAHQLGMDTVQIFTKNQRQWRPPPLSESAVRQWTDLLRELKWDGRTAAHASYLVNLASGSPRLWERSVALMLEEIERCERLRIPFLVHHPGSTTGDPIEAGIERVVRGYVHLLRATRRYRTVLCLENTAGSGSTLGAQFEQLAELRRRIVEATGEPARVAFCLDTCHAHAAGYDLSTVAGARAVLTIFDACCGLEHVRVVHINDSQTRCGSRVDRHAHIGHGTIGRRRLLQSGFAAVLACPTFRNRPKILETPKGTTPAGTDLDVLNLRRLKKLAAAVAPIITCPGRSPSGERSRAVRAIAS